MIKIYTHTTLVISLLIFLTPPVFATTCDYGSTPISLKAANKLVTDIIREIDKQTEFTIALKNEVGVTARKSIEFKQTPLDQSFKRLLKKINYSLICDGDQNKITVVFLDQTKKPAGNHHSLQEDPPPSPLPSPNQNIENVTPDQIDEDISNPVEPRSKSIKAKPPLPINTIPSTMKRTPEEIARIKAAIEKHRRKLPEHQ